MFSKKHPHLEKIEFYFEDFDPKDKFGRSLVEEDAAYYDLEEEDLDEL